jgi:hypothetical protein
MPNEGFAPADSYIMGTFEGEDYFLGEPRGIDHSENYQWHRKPEYKIKGTFDEMCDIMDNEFHEGTFYGIIGVIKREV